VTSGYLFLLTALELTGQRLPGEEVKVDEEGNVGVENNGDEMKKGSLRGGSAVTLYGFEDDPRNLADGSGGHYFDSLHKQHHSLYDVGWERRVMAGLAERTGLAEWQCQWEREEEEEEEEVNGGANATNARGGGGGGGGGRVRHVQMLSNDAAIKPSREIFEALLSNPHVVPAEAWALLGTCRAARSVGGAASLRAVRALLLGEYKGFGPSEIVLHLRDLEPAVDDENNEEKTWDNESPVVSVPDQFAGAAVKFTQSETARNHRDWKLLPSNPDRETVMPKVCTLL
jgi:hypothetical protein